MSDHEVRLESVLSELEGGHIGISEAAQLVRAMKFPAALRRTPYQSQEDADLPELDVPESGSFFMVSQAYAGGRITRRQYEALQQAAADSIRAGAAQGGSSHGIRPEEGQEDNEQGPGQAQPEEGPGN